LIRFSRREKPATLLAVATREDYPFVIQPFDSDLGESNPKSISCIYLDETHPVSLEFFGIRA
jgi:hypothetical protein